MEARPGLLERFQRFTAGGDFDVAQAALLFARAEYKDLKPEAYLDKLEALAEGARSRLASPTDLGAALTTLGKYLFDEWGFRGNLEDYYDPRNSFLNEVLDRLVGIPISLGLVYTEVGRRAGLPLAGVGFPGHFLVGADDGIFRFYVDPFHGGRIMAEGELGPLLGEVLGPSATLEPAFLRPVTPSQFLSRMLNNLKAIYLRRGDLPSALTAQEFLVILNPAAPSEVRDRGLVLYELGRLSRAQADLRRYLTLRPQAEDRVAMQAFLHAIDGHQRMYR